MPELRYNRLLGITLLGLSFISVFNKPIFGITELEILNYLDELILVLCLTLLSAVLLYSKKIPIVHLLVYTFLFYSVLISIILGFNSDTIDIVLQSLINLKFLFIFLTFILCFKNNSRDVFKFYNYVLGFALIGFFLNIILGADFNQFFNMQIFTRPNTPMRYGGFLNPNHMAFLMALFIGVVLSKAKNSGNNLKLVEWIKILASIAVIVLTDSRTAIVGVVLFFIAFYWEYMLKNIKIFNAFFGVLAFIFILLISFTDAWALLLSNLKGSFSMDGYYIRGIMINMAVQITYLHFPIGTGAATFGSLLSEGSAVYEYFGVAERSFFVEKRGIYDSSIASIVGEYGFIGILFFTAIFYRLKYFLVKTYQSKNRIMVNGLFAAFFFYSTTNPTFTNNIYILLSIPVFIKFVAPTMHDVGVNKLN